VEARWEIRPAGFAKSELQTHKPHQSARSISTLFLIIIHPKCANHHASEADSRCHLQT
jgi:hypothetical protein